MTKMETVELTGHLAKTGKSFRKIKSRDLNKFLDIQKAFAAKGAVGSQYKTYMNAMIRSICKFIFFLKQFYIHDSELRKRLPIFRYMIS